MKQSDKFDEPIMVELYEVGPTTFNTASDLLKWAENERKVWRPVYERLNNNRLYDPSFASLNAEVRNAAEIIQKISEALGLADKQQFNAHINAAKSSLSNYTNKDCLPSDSLSGQRIVQLADIDTDAAWFALAETRGITLHPNHVANLVRLIKAGQVAYDKDLDVEFATAKQRKALGALKGRWQTTLDRLSNEFDQVIDQAKSKTRNHRKFGISLERKLRKSIHDHEVRMEKMEKDFSTEMELRASERFWAAKKKVNSERAKDAFKMMTKIGGLGVLAVLVIYYLLSLIFTIGDKPNLIHGFIYALPTVAYIWIVKIFAREYRANRDMADDAEERMAMIKAFKALEYEERVGDEERLVILNAIFRPHNHNADDSTPSPIWDAVLKKLDR